MKKWLFTAAVAGAMLAACSQNEIVEDFGTPDGAPAEIAFHTPLVAPATRAIIQNQEGQEYPNTLTFAVSAQYNADADADWRDESVATNNEFAEAEPVSWKGTDPNQYWGFTNALYWPKSGYLHFQAYAPVNVDGEAVATIGTEGVKWENFTVSNASAAKQHDLLYSERAKNKQFDAASTNGAHSDINNKVEIVFNHALAQVAFTARTAEDYGEGVKINITGIALKNVVEKGTFAQGLTAAYDSQTPAGNRWTPSADENDFKENFASMTGDPLAAVEYNGGAAQAVEQDGGVTGFLVIPQSFGAAEVVVNYTIRQGSGAAIEQSAVFVLSASTTMKEGDPDTALGTAFEMGKKYTFNLVFGLNEIKFKPTVSDWEEVTVYDTTPGTILPDPSPSPSPAAPEPMILTVKPSVSGGMVTLPLAGLVNATIDWGDGSEPEAVAATIDEYSAIFHNYAGFGAGDTYSVTISGEVESLNASDQILEDARRAAIVGLEQWGQLGLRSLFFAFYQVDFVSVPTPPPGALAEVADFIGVFSDCTSLTTLPADLFSGCVSAITFSSAFYGCTSLEAVPAGLFAKNAQAYRFSQTFGRCTSLVDFKDIFVSPADDITEANRFADLDQALDITEMFWFVGTENESGAATMDAIDFSSYAYKEGRGYTWRDNFPPYEDAAVFRNAGDLKSVGHNQYVGMAEDNGGVAYPYD